MRLTSRTLGLLSVLLFVAAVWFWLRGNEEVEKRDAGRSSANSRPAAAAIPASGVSPGASNSPTGTNTAVGSPATTPTAAPQDGFPYRLRNTGRSVDELARIDTAILLDNAFLDTRVTGPLDIPADLRARGEPGSYIVQARGVIDQAFYARLRDAGAEFVSYIPNNAALVRATRDQAARLAESTQIQAVLVYEPYYKLEQSLLARAVGHQPMALDQPINVQIFPGGRESASAAIRDTGGTIISEDSTPFGPLLTVQPHPDSLPLLAGLPDVQRIEPAPARVLLNDLTRVRLGVAENTVTTNDYLNLSGNGVMVNVNDTGVDAQNPDLAGRVSTTDTNSFTTLDPIGHGTHVAGIIASSGGASSTVTQANGVPPDGSVPDADYRGKAPAAKIYALPIDLQAGPLLSDTYLQQTAAGRNFVTSSRTNAMISNNSWAYVGTYGYNFASASYDSAVRDALPGLTGSQPLVYVFAAGNDGFGTTNGAGGQSGSILSPATGKNVITVGALESPRGLTNESLAGYTDSDNEVASFSSRGNVGVGTEGTFGRFKPDVIAPGTFIVSTRSGNAFSDPSLDLGPYYRYESGTSMAAPAVAGTLALLQEFFEQQLQRGYSPALFKALLINGARSVNQNYDLRVRKILNLQGWGLVQMANSLPAGLTNPAPEQWPMRFIDQSPTNVITTGQRHTWKVALSSEAQALPLRATLVWTDPPGNPGAAIKLVNDLDLIVTNLDNGQVFIGNNIPVGADFNAANSTNSVADPDFVNNVENVFLDFPLSGTNFSITVVARRVNVNAVTANVTDIVQDYALVVSSGNGEVSDPFLSFAREGVPSFTPPLVTITNGIPLLNQHVGANFQLIPGTNGTAAQWNFYTFTNVFLTNNASGMTNGSNVAFVTFLPPNLSRPRNLDADIDLYVSQDPQLTNLNAAAVAGSFKSLHRGGTEAVIFTNAPVGPNVVYYIGVKSEDQQASEFGVVGLSTDLPFDSSNADGERVLRGYPPNVVIPDGSPENPGGALVFAIGIEPVVVGRVTVQNQITHESVGDLLGNLSHEDQFVVLNNHNRFPDLIGPVYDLFYDDSGQSLLARPTDGPGSLNNFLGQTASGVWLLTMTDDAVGRTGVVNSLTVFITPQPGATGSGLNVTNTVLANQWNYYALDVPADATNLTVCLSGIGSPLNLYVRREQLPTATEFDKSALINPTFGCLTLGIRDVPPLNAGRYYIGVFNPTAVPVTYVLNAIIDVGLNAANTGEALSTDTPREILDDAVTTSSVFVPTSRPVVDVRVGVRIDHPRASDLVLHVTGPQGGRTLLAENRGGDSTLGYGATRTTTNVFQQSFDGGPEENRNVIDTGLTSGTVKIDYDFFQVSDSLRVYYQSVLLYDTGVTNGAGSISVNFGPGLSTVVTIVVNEGGSTNATTRWEYVASVVQETQIYTTFTDSTNLASIPIKFATPPFTNSAVGSVRTNAVIMSDGFENATNGIYAVGSFISGWQVTYGTVAVRTNLSGVLPDSGTNFVEMLDGSPSSVRTNVLLVPDRPYRLTFAYHRNPNTTNQANVVAVYTNGVLGQFVFVRGTGWQTATHDFQVSDSSINLEIRSAGRNGCLIDTVQIAENAEFENRFFLPEEPLKPLVGETALGQWSLELEDNRAGPPGAAARSLVGWQIEFTFANTNFPAITLTNCVPDTNVVSLYEPGTCDFFTNTVVRDQIKYFIVEVPRSATAATNLLSGSGDLRLLYSPVGLPTGGFAGDLVVDTPGNTETLLLTTNVAPPQLQPGQRYYLGVGNATTNATNTFVISVAFDRIDTNLINAIALTNGVSYSRTIPVTNAVDYYQFTVSSNATDVTFDVVPVNGNVDLVVRKALPVADPLPRPTPGEYDYISENPTNAPEQIIVTPTSQPVPLTPGVWYAGVYNVDVVPVDYTITVTEGTNTLPNIILLTNAVPLNFAIGAGSAFTNFFLFDVTQTNAGVLYELYNLNADGNLLLNYDNLPTPALFIAEQLGTPALPAQIVIRTNLGIPSINGRWYLAVDNLQNTNLTFTIRATVTSTNGMLISGIPLTVNYTPGAPPFTSVDMEWYSIVGETYAIETSTDLVTWNLRATVIATDILTAYSDPIDPAEPTLFYRVRQIP